MEELARVVTDEKKDLDLHIDFNEIKKAAIILRAINHPVRQEILRTIH